MSFKCFKSGRPVAHIHTRATDLTLALLELEERMREDGIDYDYAEIGV